MDTELEHVSCDVEWILYKPAKNTEAEHILGEGNVIVIQNSNHNHLPPPGERPPDYVCHELRDAFVEKSFGKGAKDFLGQLALIEKYELYDYYKNDSSLR